MMNAKMTFVHYSREDVIATSSISFDEFCPSFGATHYQIVSRNNPQSRPGQGIYVYNVYEYSYDAVNGLVPMSERHPSVVSYGNAVLMISEEQAAVSEHHRWYGSSVRSSGSSPRRVRSSCIPFNRLWTTNMKHGPAVVLYISRPFFLFLGK